MKKVFHIVSNNWSSGLEKVVMNICKMVPGIDFTYVAPSGKIIDDLKKNGIKYIEVKKITPSVVKHIVSENNIDVIHGHDVKSSLCIAANYFSCKRKHIKMISELHNDDNRMHRYSIRGIIYAISSFLYDEIVLVSSNILINYKFRKLIEKKSTIIDNVINPEILEVVTQDYEKKSDFIFVGRLEYQKNPLLFLEFIKEIKSSYDDVKAYIIGKGSLRKLLEDFIKDNNLEKNVKMLGYRSNPYGYIKNTKSVVITSRYEGLCMVALESLLIGTPIITTDVNGVSELVTKSCGLKSNNLHELTRYGLKIMKDPSFLDLARDGAKKRSRVVNNVNSFINKYKNIYENK